MGTCVSGRICACCPSTSRARLPTGTQLTLGTSLVKKLPEAEEDITRPEVTAAAVPCKSREMQECQGRGEQTSRAFGGQGWPALQLKVEAGEERDGNGPEGFSLFFSLGSCR